MGRTGSPPDQFEPESIDVGIARWASHAAVRTLTALLMLGVLGSALVLLLGWQRWPVAGLLLTVATIAAWGLVEQRARHPHTRLVALSESLLTGLGGLLAVATALGFLFALLGPAPIL
jgi:hypothetical protein